MYDIDVAKLYVWNETTWKRQYLRAGRKLCAILEGLSAWTQTHLYGVGIALRHVSVSKSNRY